MRRSMYKIGNAQRRALRVDALSCPLQRAAPPPGPGRRDAGRGLRCGTACGHVSPARDERRSRPIIKRQRKKEGDPSRIADSTILTTDIVLLQLQA